mgnify:CR=1 FL=1
MGAHDELNTAWVEFCDSLKAAGAAVLASHHASDDVSAAEGMRHLARMVSMSLTQWIDFSDTSDPRLFRSNDDVWQWGGPNVDNVYIGAPLDPTGTYRLTGDVSGQPGAVLQVLGQPSGDDPIAVRVDRSLAGGVDGTGRVDLVLSGDESVDADVRLPAGEGLHGWCCASTCHRWTPAARASTSNGSTHVASPPIARRPRWRGR